VHPSTVGPHHCLFIYKVATKSLCQLIDFKAFSKVRNASLCLNYEYNDKITTIDAYMYVDAIKETVKCLSQWPQIQFTVTTKVMMVNAEFDRDGKKVNEYVLVLVFILH